MIRIAVLAFAIASAASVHVPAAAADDRCQRAMEQYDAAYADFARWCNRGGRTSCPYPGGPEGQRVNYALDQAEDAVRRECH